LWGFELSYVNKLVSGFYDVWVFLGGFFNFEFTI
jgi:hypothetical protein